MAARNPSSVRLSDAELELVNAWADYLAHQTGATVGTAAVFRAFLRRTKPPESQGPDQARIRRAYTAIYGDG
jgi:hypothetical protein